MLPAENLATHLARPVVTMANYQPRVHPNLIDLDRRARQVLKSLATFGAGLDANEGELAWVSETDPAAAMESWSIAADGLQRFIDDVGGRSTQRFLRELRKHLPRRAAEVEQMLIVAERWAQEYRAFSLVMADRDDDTGIDVIPSISPDGEKPRTGPSVSFDW